MLVKVERGATVEISEMDDLQSLAVYVDADVSSAEAAETLRSAGLSPEDAVNSEEHVWLKLDRLEAAAGPHLYSGEEWQSGWRAMIAYATRKQWISEDKTLVRAHIDYA